MPVKVMWDNDAKTIIRHIYEGELVADDYYLAAEQTLNLANGVKHTVHLIIDNRKVTKRAAGFIKILHRLNRLVPPNLGIKVLLHASQKTFVLIEIGKSIAPQIMADVYIARSDAEALSIIQARVD